MGKSKTSLYHQHYEARWNSNEKAISQDNWSGNRSLTRRNIIWRIIWVNNAGKAARLDIISFSHANMGVMLLEPSGTRHFNIDTLAARINRLLPGKQVIFSTDLNVEDSQFWLELAQRIAEEIRANKSFYFSSWSAIHNCTNYGNGVLSTYLINERITIFHLFFFW